MSEAFRAGSVDSQFHVGTAIDSIFFRFSGGAASEDGGGSTKGEDIVDPPVDPEVIEL